MPVNVAPVADSVDPDAALVIVYCVEKAIVAFADAVAVDAEELLGAGGPGVVLQVVKNRRQPAADIFRELEELFARLGF